MAIDFKKALDMVKERGLFQGITRFKYDGEGYDLNESLQLVEAIGKQRNPKFVIDDENRFTYENIIKWLHCFRYGHRSASFDKVLSRYASYEM